MKSSLIKRVVRSGRLLVGLGMAVGLGGAVADSVLIDLGRVDALESALREHGWRVERDPEGALLLYPKGAAPAPVANSAPLAPEAKPAPPMESTGEWVPMTDLEGIQRALQARGWRTERKDGDLLVYPKTAAAAPPAPQKQDGPASAAPVEIDTRDLDTLQAVAAQRGWGQRREADGSLILHPFVPELAAAGEAGCQSGMVKVNGVADNELPIDSWAKARALAERWVARNEASRYAIGKIRQVNELYLVSLTEPNPPHRLRSQLVIRSADGCVMAVTR